MSGATRVVLDASLTLAWALPDESTPYAEAMLEYVAATGAMAPDLWPHEVANGLLMAQRRGRITTAQRTAFVTALLRLPIEISASPVRTVLDAQATLAEHHRLTAYDAAYLHLALREGVPLATQDKALKAAAKVIGVAVR